MIEDNWCKWVANIKLDCFCCNVITPAATIDKPETVSVPEHNSSPRTKVLESALFIIDLSSLSFKLLSM